MNRVFKCKKCGKPIDEEKLADDPTVIKYQCDCGQVYKWAQGPAKFLIKES